METRGWKHKQLAAAADLDENTISDALKKHSRAKQATLEAIAHSLGFASWTDLALHIPHDLEACGRLVTSAVTLPDDDASRQLALIWGGLTTTDRHILLTLALGLQRRTENPDVDHDGLPGTHEPSPPTR
jgi:hypothetical protein